MKYVKLRIEVIIGELTSWVLAFFIREFFDVIVHSHIKSVNESAMLDDLDIIK